MNLKTYTVSLKGDFEDSEIDFNPETREYLINIDKNVYDEWYKRFNQGKRDKSLSFTIKHGVFPRLNEIISQNGNPKYNLIYFFGNKYSIDEKIINLIYESKKSNESHLILVQTENHKVRFKYDDSTMTISMIKERFKKIMPIIKSEINPKIYVLTLHDYIGFKPQMKYISGIRHMELVKYE